MVSDLKKKDTNRYLIPITARLLSIAATFLIVLIFIFVSVNVTGYIYDLMHPMSKGQKDLGFGLAMLFWLFIALVCAVVAIYPIYKYVFKKIRKLLGGKND